MARITQLSVRLSLLLVAVVAAFLLIGGAGADAGTPPQPPIEHVVRSGDTLWALAATHTEAGEDVRVMVEAIKRSSGLANSTIRPGQVLYIPQS
jgi:Tfp pilus assembly protein FimV